jgi:6-phosphogluconolactonase
MKTIQRLFLAALAVSTLSCGGPRADHTVNLFVGSFTEAGGDGLYVCRFDTLTGALSDLRTVARRKDPTYLTLSDDGERLYTYNNLRPDTAELLTYAVDRPTGSLTELARIKVPALTLSYVEVIDGGTGLATVSYSEGNTIVYPLDENGVTVDRPALYVHTEASGVTPRQRAPHAHAVMQEPATGELYVTDLGADRTLIFDRQGDSLQLNAEIVYAPGSGPRHLAFHPGGRYMATVGELDNTVSLLARDSMQRFTRLLQTITTLPGGAFDGETTSADIHFTPDGRFLYSSNRGENSIAIYRFDAERGELASLGWLHEGIDFPRNFTIDPTWKFMLVANQKGNDITVYALDAETGALTPVPHRIEVLEPVCLKFQP